MNSFYAVAWHFCSLSQPRGGRFFIFLRRGDMTIQSENDELESGKVETISWRTGDFVKIGNVSNWKIEEFENCIVIEDSISGVLAAKSAGIRVIGMLGQHTKQDFEELKTFGFVSQLNELLGSSIFVN